MTDGDVKLIDKNKMQSLLIGIFFGVSAYGSFKTKKKSKSLSLKVTVAVYESVRLWECKNTEFVWESK